MAVTLSSKLKVNPVTAGVARAAGRFLCRSVQTYVFVATTGRSGTHTLQRLFKTVPSCVSLHEPHPVMNGEVLWGYNDGDDRSMRRTFKLRKLPHVYWAARNKRFYVEANHVLIKCFAEAAVDTFGDRLRVLRLRRDPNAVASSYLMRGCVPGTNNEKRPHLSGNEWLIDPLALSQA